MPKNMFYYFWNYPYRRKDSLILYQKSTIKCAFFHYLAVFVKKANDLLSKKSINFIIIFIGMFIKLLYDLLQKKSTTLIKNDGFSKLYLNLVLEA